MSNKIDLHYEMNDLVLQFLLISNSALLYLYL